METNGIGPSLERKNQGGKAFMFAASAAVIGVAFACAAFGFACGQSRSGAPADAANGLPASDDAGSAHEPAGNVGNSEQSNGSRDGASEQQPAGDEDPDSSTATPMDEPTATPTDEPTATPTATPDGGTCVFCPEDVDDIIIPATTPIDPCAFCIDPVIVADPALLAFEYHTTKNCDGHSELSAGLNRVAWIWVEYTTADGEDVVESPKHWNDSIYVEVPAKWVWFGDWGWIYAYDVTFHAMDEDGKEIMAYDIVQSC